jgi:polysaccharide export outer membrane protein
MILISPFFFSGNISAQNNPSALSSAHSKSREGYVINRGDVIDVTVMQHPEFSISGIIVMPDGTIQYPGLGSIVAAGMTSSALKDTIQTALDRYVVNPLVTIYVKKIQGETINIFGYVNRPGQYQIFVGMDLFSVLSMAGGIKSIKKARKITIIKADNTFIELRIKDYFGSRTRYTMNDIPLIYSGDTIYVMEPKDINWSRLSFFSSMLLAVANILNIIL